MASRNPLLPLRRYLTSPKNAAGTILGAAGFAAAGPWGVGLGGVQTPIVVALLYGVGAVFAPSRSHASKVSQVAQAVSAAQLRAELQKLVDATDHKRARLPHEAYVVFHEVVTQLRDILTRAEQLTTSPENLHVVGATIRDYLPTSIDAYVTLGTTGATTSTMTGARTAEEELLRQMEILRDQMIKVRASVFAGDVAALETQGRFLEDKFHRSDLDL